MSRSSRILVAHPWMGRGGSEAAALWTLQALQDAYEVDFLTASPVEWNAYNGAYGTAVDPDRVRYVRAPALPGVNGPEKMVHLHRRHFEKTCRRMADQYDLCISAYNPVDFGRPGIQLIGDFSFSEKMRRILYTVDGEKPRHRDTMVRRAYLAAGDLAGVPRTPLSERGDLILANSRWTVGQLAEHFGVPDAPVIYPPVILPRAIPGVERDPLGFACLGRVAPEKEIERIVTILTAVRKAGHPVRLQFVGRIGDDDYGRKVAKLIETGRDWICPRGFLDLEEKQNLLSRQSFALHACRIEAFGIAVAEMASLGCVPFIPATGGAGEIVTIRGLRFETVDEAVEKIVFALENPDTVGEWRTRLAVATKQFGPEVFMKELREHVAAFGRRGAPVAAR